MNYHFISGLPRSGSTLLAALLRQNPLFHASIMSPLGQVVTKTLEGMGSTNEAEQFMTPDQRLNMLRGLFDGYYAYPGADVTDVVFDNNRRWCANAALLDQLFPGSKIICLVRPPADIADSFERLFRKNPTYLSLIYSGLSNSSVYERMVEIMRPTGVLGFSLSAFRDAYFGPQHNNLLVIEYEHLCRFPKDVLAQLHASLGLPEFEYRFDKIDQIPGAAAFDAHIGTPGLHDLKPTIAFEARASILPPDLRERLPDPFWRVKEEATPET